MIALEQSDRETLPPPYVPGALIYAATLAAIRRCTGHDADEAEALLLEALRSQGIETAVLAHVCPLCSGLGTLGRLDRMACTECRGHGTVPR